MELNNGQVIFSRREKRALSLETRVMPAYRLEGFWDSVWEANSDRMVRLDECAPPLGRIWRYMLCQGNCGAAAVAARMNYGSRDDVLRERRVLDRLDHSVRAIICETLPEVVDQLQPPDATEL